MKHPTLLLSGAVFSWLSIKYLPSAMIVFWLVASVLLDLITGVLKAWSKGEGTTSTGLRRTVVKIGSYVGTIVMVIILVNLIGIVDVNNKYNLTILIDSLTGFMVFIELYSICENIAEAFPNSPLSQYLIRPLIKILKGKLKNTQLLPDQENKDDARTEAN
jgi:phage-related holin